MDIGGFSSGDTWFTYRSEDEGISARVADALNDNDIFDLVKILHMSTTGSGDPLSTAEWLLVTARLQTRLQHWREPSSEYDDHVRRWLEPENQKYKHIRADAPLIQGVVVALVRGVSAQLARGTGGTGADNGRHLKTRSGRTKRSQDE